MAAAFEPKDLGQLGQARVLGQAPQVQRVGRRVILQDLAGGRDPVVDQGGGGFGGLVLGASGQRRDAELLRVGVEDVGMQGLACGGAQHQHKAVLFDRLDKGLDAGQLDLPQQGHQLLR